MDWLQFCLAMAMAFVGLESMASGLRMNARELSWLAAWAAVWLVAAAGVVVTRLLTTDF